MDDEYCWAIYYILERDGGSPPQLLLLQWAWTLTHALKWINSCYEPHKHYICLTKHSNIIKTTNDNSIFLR